MQPRFDWEAEEQRINDLEDLALQLVEHIYGLEKSQTILEQEYKAKSDIHSNRIATLLDRVDRLEFAVQELERPYYEKKGDWEKPMGLVIEEPGQQIAKAIKAQEDAA